MPAPFTFADAREILTPQRELGSDRCAAPAEAATPERAATHMPHVFDDGGRAAAAFKGSAGDCVTRAVAIVSGRPYAEVYQALARGTGEQRATRRTGKKAASARNGVWTKRKWFKDYMRSLGFVWTPTMAIGQGCKVHLVAGELPPGRHVVAVSKHYTAVVDGVVRDTYDPQRRTVEHVAGPHHPNGDREPDPARGEWRNGNGVWRPSERCVYGFWSLPAEPSGDAQQRPDATDGRDPDHSRPGMFAYHDCWRCDHGAKPCVNGAANLCGNPRARND